MNIILASKSKGRKELLNTLGLEYNTITSNADENIKEKDPYLLVKKLSELKAKSVGEKLSDALVVAGDLIVYHKKKIVGKPKTIEEAFQMLKSMSGKRVKIIGGVAVFNTKSKSLHSDSSEAIIKFRKLSDEEIGDYIENYPVLNFAAAFDVKGIYRFAEHVSGDIGTMSGLPLNKLITMLRANGVKV